MDCTGPHWWAHFPGEWPSWSATLLGDVVQLVTAAVPGGKGQLQFLELLAGGASDEPGTEVQQVAAGARAALPKPVVEVRWKRDRKIPLPPPPPPNTADILAAENGAALCPCLSGSTSFLYRLRVSAGWLHWLVA